MKQVDEIIYDAICADEVLMAAIGGQDRVTSTCFEVSPYEKDNMPLPNIIVTDDGFQNQDVTKDSVWEGGDDLVQTTVDIAAKSPKEVKRLARMVRRAISRYIVQMYTDNPVSVPDLERLSSDGIIWDWTKPCYFQHLNYQCSIKSDIENEQEDN